MVEYTTPAGRNVEVEPYGDDMIVVKWSEANLDNQIVLKRGLTLEEIDDACEKYLYGYDDPETGEHIPGVTEMLKDTTTTTDELVKTS